MAFKYKYRTKKKWNSRLIVSVVALLLLSLLSLYALFYPTEQQPTATTTTTTTTTTTVLPTQAELGRLLVAVKDVQYHLPGGNVVLNISMKIGNITAHHVPDSEANETEGEWILVSSDVNTIELLEYTDIIAIIGENVMVPGKYTQIRMYIIEANVTVKNTIFGIYTGKVYPMIVPSNELKTAHQFSIDADKTTVVTIDFDVEKSVSRTADGYMLKPVVKVTDESIGYDEQLENSEVIS